MPNLHHGIVLAWACRADFPLLQPDGYPRDLQGFDGAIQDILFVCLGPFVHNFELSMIRGQHAILDNLRYKTEREAERGPQRLVSNKINNLCASQNY